MKELSSEKNAKYQKIYKKNLKKYFFFVNNNDIIHTNVLGGIKLCSKQ